MTINVWMGGDYRDIEVIEPDEPERKRWCEETLAEFFKSTRCGIKMIDYFMLNNHSELIRVYYDTEGNCHKDVWITADSYAAIVEDMYRARVIY